MSAKTEGPALTQAQIKQLVNTFRPVRGKIQDREPHIVLLDGQPVATSSGKKVWPSRGAAMNAITHHIEALLSSVLWNKTSKNSDWAWLEEAAGERREAGRVRLSLLNSGRMEVVPLHGKTCTDHEHCKDCPRAV